MGRNLALNLGDHGVPLVVWERDPDLAAIARAALPVTTVWADSAAAVARALPSPKAVLLMVQAGPAVDAVIAALRPALGPDDIIIDGGNADTRDTERRQRALTAEGGPKLIGLGVSGGADGARRGPALMAGGDAAAWEHVRPALAAIAARTGDGAACCALLGDGAAGHFVKTVHNGIEYAVMQALAEAYDAMRGGLGLDVDAIAEVFAHWNTGKSKGFLVEIAAEVMLAREPDGTPLIDRIVDRAGQKGTGRWASLAALEHGVAAPTIVEAVFARAVSSRSEERRALNREPPPGRLDLHLDALADAVHAATIAAFVQGFDMIAAAGAAQGWHVRAPEVARVWRAGCILRATLLDRLAVAAEAVPAGASLLQATELRAELDTALPGLRRTVAAASLAGIPVPVHGSALAWIEGMTRARGPANLLQGLRDRFGAHGFERTDAPGTHHGDWRRE
ncbi:MAG: NADP-dependent phosphogluconate dehydrogenase [Alphaproteobacteria bacterium]|nr:NADP-dependent phosphogluconate dehydrogenase [Alphaproteobacteria bacterium]